MRTEEEMMQLILNTACEDERIRAVIMNGSRVNPNVEKDCFQDYDIVFVVRDVDSFTSNHQWVDRFGEIMIMQMPEDMSLLPPEDNGCFAYLMQFMDGNRIDLTLVPVDIADEHVGNDSLSVLLLDKDHLFEPFPPATDDDYHIKPPTAKQYADCCNEFWWVSTYVCKGLWREELPYAKAMLDGPVRNMLIQMLDWHIGVENNFSISTGYCGKYLERYLDDETWNKYKDTYSDAVYEHIWKSLFTMCDLFRSIAVKVASHFNYEYPLEDDRKVTAHLKHVKLLEKDAQEIYKRR